MSVFGEREGEDGREGGIERERGGGGVEDGREQIKYLDNPLYSDDITAVFESHRLTRS